MSCPETWWEAVRHSTKTGSPSRSIHKAEEIAGNVLSGQLGILCLGWQFISKLMELPSLAFVTIIHNFEILDKRNFLNMWAQIKYSIQRQTLYTNRTITPTKVKWLHLNLFWWIAYLGNFGSWWCRAGRISGRA